MVWRPMSMKSPKTVATIEVTGRTVSGPKYPRSKTKPFMSITFRKNEEGCSDSGRGHDILRSPLLDTALRTILVWPFRGEIEPEESQHNSWGRSRQRGGSAHGLSVERAVDQQVIRQRREERCLPEVIVPAKRLDPQPSDGGGRQFRMFWLSSSFKKT
jgi:hypothetical protein